MEASAGVLLATALAATVFVCVAFAVMALAVLATASVLGTALAGPGVYVSSFSWPLRAYRERGFNSMTLLQVAFLVVAAFIIPPVLMWTGRFSF